VDDNLNGPNNANTGDNYSNSPPNVDQNGIDINGHKIAGQQNPQQPFPTENQQGWYQTGNQFNEMQGQVQPHVPISGGGTSPEVPSRIETGEKYFAPEYSEQEKGVEKTEADVVKKDISQKEFVKTPDVAPEQQKFENPFRNVYGYRISGNIANSVKKGKRNKVKGTSSAKTWLVVLLERLLRMYNVDTYKTRTNTNLI